MAKELKVDCDVCRKILKSTIEAEDNDQAFMSQLHLIFNNVGLIDKKDEKTKKKNKHRFILETHTYEIQLCDKCAPGFMDHIAKFFKDKGNEIAY